jgi:hypothetical protein
VKPRALALALLLGLARCAPDAVLHLRVEAPLVVPQECDALDVKVTRNDGSGAVLFDQRYDLSNGPSFPLSLNLLTEEQNLGEPGVTAQVAALLGGADARPWSKGSGSMVLARGQISTLVLRLCDCP